MLTEVEKTRHLPFLQTVADADVAQLLQKDREYGASWKSRGGVGAFMMLARKWDRLENMVKALRTYRATTRNYEGGHELMEQEVTASAYDVFEHVRGSELERADAESLLDTLGDLRRYLLLVEAEVIASRPGAVSPEKAEALANGGVVRQSDYDPPKPADHHVTTRLEPWTPPASDPHHDGPPVPSSPAPHVMVG